MWKDRSNNFIDAGVAAKRLIVDPRSWINRRVETVEMLVQEETRRRASVDFTLSDEAFQSLQIADGYVVPITLLSKQPRRNFDLLDESGRSVPVLGRTDNGDLAQVAVLAAILGVVGDATPVEALDLIAADVERVVMASPSDAFAVLSPFREAGAADDELRGAIWADSDCRSLLTSFSTDYALFAVLAERTNRRILKYGYGEDLPAPDRLAPLVRATQWLDEPDKETFIIDCPGAWRARSFHMEIAIAAELKIEFAELYDAAGAQPSLGEADHHVNRAALFARQIIEPHADVRCWVEVAQERGSGALRAAAWSTATSALLWAGVASGLRASNPGAAVSILLAGVALVSSLSARAERHVTVRRIFRTRQRALALVTSAGLLGSASLALEFPCARPVWVWVVAAVAATVATMTLCWTAVRAPD